MMRPPPRSPLFPTTTLFRSVLVRVVAPPAADGLLELAHAAADRPADLGQALRAQDDEGEHQDDQQFLYADSEWHDPVSFRLTTTRWRPGSRSPRQGECRSPTTGISTRRRTDRKSTRLNSSHANIS